MTGKSTSYVHATKKSTVALMLLTTTLGKKITIAIVLETPYAAQVKLMLQTSSARAKYNTIQRTSAALKVRSGLKTTKTFSAAALQVTLLAAIH